MTPDDGQRHLSDIVTLWPDVETAQAGGEESAAAQARLFERYGGAVRRYLLAMVRDQALADDLTQEFAVALVGGNMRNANPQRGRFRDYVKGILFHLVSTHRRRQQRHEGQARALTEEPAAPSGAETAESDRVFQESWRQELLARTWASLAEANSTLFTVLYQKAANPAAKADALAQALKPHLAKPLTPEAVRQMLHRARERFGELLRLEVARSLGDPTQEQVEEELRELSLLVYCQSASG
jgi:RNA polymerase sigma-70 factor (ECF subfamily)